MSRLDSRFRATSDIWFAGSATPRRPLRKAEKQADIGIRGRGPSPRDSADECSSDEEAPPENPALPPDLLAGQAGIMLQTAGATAGLAPGPLLVSNLRQ